MKSIEIEGRKYRVIENLGYQPSSGVYAKMVDVNGEERMAVKLPQGIWRFWTARDRTEPIREALARKNKGENAIASRGSSASGFCCPKCGEPFPAGVIGHYPCPAPAEEAAP